MLRAYKRFVSPALPPACRFVPTCSEYAMEAVERHGALRGGARSLWRLLRCHPLAKGGYDPVPNAEGGHGTEEMQVRRLRAPNAGALRSG
jgi:putative membrane protein insertion efficiency factor